MIDNNDYRFIDRKMERLFGHMTLPFLMIFREKHGGHYYLINTPEDVFIASLAQVKKVFENYGGDAAITDSKKIVRKDKKKQIPDNAEEIIKSLNFEPRREISMTNEIAFQKADHVENIRYLHDLEQMKKAITKKDGKLAFLLVDSRSAYEYEDWSFESFDNVGGNNRN